MRLTKAKLLRKLIVGCGLALVLAVGYRLIFPAHAKVPEVTPGTPYSEIELKLPSLAKELSKPMPGEWLHTYPEAGQSFDDYQRAQPTRRSDQHRTIYLCLIGPFSKEQKRILEIPQEYLALVFDGPVKVFHKIDAGAILDKARRKHYDGQLQLLTNYFLYDYLVNDRPADALAYVAFTSSDLWTRDSEGRDWNYVFGQADIRNRLGVWSLARFGDPAESSEAFARCLKLTLGTATHETGHILTLLHCVYYQCNMNGSNHLPEALKAPLPFCPICLRKLCWNLQVDPNAYLKRLQIFSAKHGLKEDELYYQRAIELLSGPR